MPPRHVPATVAPPAAMVRARTNVRPGRSAPAYDEEEEATQCPLCCENLDETEKKHRPCPCGYQVCLFCLSRLQAEYGNRCPACRTRYGTDPEEWERQREARATESQTQRPPPTPKPQPRATESHDARPSSSRSPSRASARDEGDKNTRRDVGALRGYQDASQRQPVPAVVHDRPVDADWPSLSQGPSRAAAAPAPQAQGPEADAPGRARAPSINAEQVHQRPQKSPKASTLNLPVNVQSLVNGTNTSLETVIDLSPPSGELHTYIQRDVQPLLQQLMSLKTNKPTNAQASLPRQAAASAVVANRRQNATNTNGPAGAPPGLERRDIINHAAHSRQMANASAAAAVAVIPSAIRQPCKTEPVASQDEMLSAFSKPPVQESFTKQPGALPSGPMTQATNGQVSAPGNLPATPAPALPPPPGLGPPPGFGPVPVAAPLAPVVGPSMVTPPGLVDPAESAPGSRNILHELFLQDNRGKLGWFAKPPGFEGNLHQLLDTSAPLSELMRPVRNAARHRRPLYARAADATSVAASQEGSASGQRGSSAGDDTPDQPRDPVVSLGRKLGGRHAEIGASLH